MEIFIVFLIVIILILLLYIYEKKSFMKKKNHILKKIQEEWDTLALPETEVDLYDLKKSYDYMSKLNYDNEIDDITWNDMEMDSVFKNLNYTKSFMGEMLLYKILRNPVNDLNILKEREQIIDIFYNNKDLRERKLFQLMKIGKLNHISIWEYKNNICDITYSKQLHFLFPIILLLTLLIIPIKIIVGIPLSIFVLSVNIYTYYRDKAKIENYIPLLVQIGTMLNSIKGLNEITNYSIIDRYTQKLTIALILGKKYNKYLSMIRTTINGYITEMDTAVDYIRIITHMDLIAFIKLVNYINSNIELIQECYETIGYIDSMIAVAQFKRQHNLRYKDTLCLSTPNLLINETGLLMAKDLFNPLLQNPKTNSFDIKKSILITGSNATGKSTFLRTVGINAILAQTVYIVCSREYHSSLFRVYSSMNIKDNIFNASSYYMMEIRSIKRMLDAVNSNITLLCCIDEVLRGTNTIERIGAASEILKSLAQSNVLCLAATHDIELSYILENLYDNYHFQERVIEDDITFDYYLYSGRSYTRNAIQLLRLLGYSNDIVSNAVKKVNNYISSGIWSVD